MTVDGSAGSTTHPPDTAGAPVVVDLGKRRRKLVRRLRKGTGKLMDEVQAAIDEIQRAGRIPATAQPVIVIVTQKTKNRRLRMPMMW